MTPDPPPGELLRKAFDLCLASRHTQAQLVPEAAMQIEPDDRELLSDLAAVPLRARRHDAAIRSAHAAPAIDASHDLSACARMPIRNGLALMQRFRPRST